MAQLVDFVNAELRYHPPPQGAQLDPRAFDHRRRGRQQPTAFGCHSDCGVDVLLSVKLCAQDPVLFFSRAACRASLQVSTSPLEMLRARADFACRLLRPRGDDAQLARARARAFEAAFEIYEIDD